MRILIVILNIFIFLLTAEAQYRTVLDDFEDSNDRHNLGGVWYSYNDKVDAGEGSPHSLIYPNPFFLTLSGVLGSEFCAGIEFDLTGSFAPNPYAALETSLVDDKVVSYVDLSGYTGIGFWLKASSSVSAIQLRFNYNNYPGLDKNIESGGKTPRAYTLKGLSTSWKFYAVCFTNFKVPDWIRTDVKYDGITAGGEILFDPYATEKRWDKMINFSFYLQPPDMSKGQFWADNVILIKAGLQEMKKDNDHDGYNNYLEYGAGTDINDKNEYPEESVLMDRNKNGKIDKDEKIFISDISVQPNPMNSSEGTVITISLSKVSDTLQLNASIRVIDSTGRSVNEQEVSLFNGQEFSFTWSGKNRVDKKVSPGLYLIQVSLSGKGEEEDIYRTVIVK